MQPLVPQIMAPIGGRVATEKAQMAFHLATTTDSSTPEKNNAVNIASANRQWLY